MISLLVRRLAGAAAVVLLASMLVALLVHLVPGDAAEVVAGENASSEQVAAIRRSMGLDRPVLEQVGGWLAGAVRGDLGTSLVTSRSVSDSLADALPPTLSITALATAIALLLGVTGGAVAGIGQGSWVDRVASLATTLGIAMPSFWIGMLLVSSFALDLGWLPATGYVSPADGVGDWARHVVLPAAALGTAMAAEIARQTRSGVIDVLARPYIRTARAKGASLPHIIRRHVLRNASIPVVTVLGLQVGQFLGGVIVVEQVFGINGLGTIAVTAVMNRDFPLIQGYVLLTTLVMVSVNLLVDLSYGWINPRARVT